MSIVLLIHIVTFSASVLLTVAVFLKALFGKRVAASLSKANLAATACGVGTGTLLLFPAPISAYCLALGTYILLFAGVTHYVSRRNNQLLSLADR